MGETEFWSPLLESGAGCVYLGARGNARGTGPGADRGLVKYLAAHRKEMSG